MTEWLLHPALLLIGGALLIPLLHGKAQQVYRVALPLALVAWMFSLPQGEFGVIQVLDFELVLARADKLSLVFGYVFSIICVVGAVYSLHVRDNIQHVAAYIYAGSALGVVFAGDLITLYVFWEVMVFSSVWLIWRRRDPVSFAAGWRYLLVHSAGGVILLAGVVLHSMQTGSIAFNELEYTGLAFYLILVGFMINAAVPPLHAWLADAYPESTLTGAIFLSALTTKTAVYTLIRGFPGTEILVWLGVIMALYGVVYAVLANDIRRLLAYHIVSQVGYMVAGVGMGTIIALNGATSHAFTHILYKSLLFMGAGAVIHMTGKSKLTELGGVYRWMPITFLLYMIGALSISAFPLFSGFVSKTMVVEAAAVERLAVVWLLLSLASAGTFLHTGLKLPWFTFMGPDRGLRPKEAPVNMLVAMAIAAFFCVFIGVYPDWLYQMLPAPVDYNAYTSGHVLWELQVLLFTGLGFFLLLKHVGGEAKISLDTDWFYRKAGPWLVHKLAGPIRATNRAIRAASGRLLQQGLIAIQRFYGRDGVLVSAWPSGSMVLSVAIMLAILLIAALF
jgi:multicomponent Na+:H+ antiporter subunit D